MSNDLHVGTQGQEGSRRNEYVRRFREMDTRASERIGFGEMLAYCMPWLLRGATDAGASRQEDGKAQHASEAERGRKAGSAGRGGAEEKGKEGGGDDQEAGKVAAGSSHALLAQLVRSGKGEVHSSTRTTRTHARIDTHTDMARRTHTLARVRAHTRTGGCLPRPRLFGQIARLAPTASLACKRVHSARSGGVFGRPRACWLPPSPGLGVSLVCILGDPARSRARSVLVGLVWCLHLSVLVIY